MQPEEVVATTLPRSRPVTEHGGGTNATNASQAKIFKTEDWTPQCLTITTLRLMGTMTLKV